MLISVGFQILADVLVFCNGISVLSLKNQPLFLLVQHYTVYYVLLLTQIKIIIRYHLTLVRMTIIKKNQQTINAGVDIEKREPFTLLEI